MANLVAQDYQWVRADRVFQPDPFQYQVVHDCQASLLAQVDQVGPLVQEVPFYMECSPFW